MVWTKERLTRMVQNRFGEVCLMVVSNREPVMHVCEEGRVRCLRPAGGLTAGLEPVMQTCGGIWVAHGSGNADWLVCDAEDRVGIPEERPAYTLKRVWLTEEELRGYYDGFANQALWPLCLQIHTQPQFHPEEWQHYVQVNHKFARAILAEAPDGPTVVFVQDYHFALLPRILKQVRPDLVVLQFWHIPWPTWEVFRICPWKEQLVHGLLGNDLLGFHGENDCHHFLQAVLNTMDAHVEAGHSLVTYHGRPTRVRAQPLGIDPASSPGSTRAVRQEVQALREQFDLTGQQVLVGVDRVDSAKGIPERLRAIDYLLNSRPEWRGRVTLVQVASPSRLSIPTYQRLNEELHAQVESINQRHRVGRWQPVVYLHETYPPEWLERLYRLASACVVSSLHDGMNLVAKEFVAARDDLRGVLVLSQFAGAAEELHEALPINPYGVEQFADALHQALVMPEGEQERRMRSLRRQVRHNNVYRWAGQLLAEASAFVRPQSLPTTRKWGPPRVQQRVSLLEACS